MRLVDILSDAPSRSGDRRVTALSPLPYRGARHPEHDGDQEPRVRMVSGPTRVRSATAYVRPFFSNWTPRHRRTATSEGVVASNYRTRRCGSADRTSAIDASTLAHALSTPGRDATNGGCSINRVTTLSSTLGCSQAP